MDICKAQILAERRAAKNKFQVCAEIEENEIKALCVEDSMLNQFIDVWHVRLGKVAKGTPAYFMVQAQIDMYDLRKDVVAMEKRMYTPTYLKRAENIGKYPAHISTHQEKLLYDTFRIRGDGKGGKGDDTRLAYDVATKPITWIYKKQFAKVCHFHVPALYCYAFLLILSTRAGRHYWARKRSSRP